MTRGSTGWCGQPWHHDPAIVCQRPDNHGRVHAATDSQDDDATIWWEDPEEAQ